MKYAYTIIYVKNVPETIAFYQRAFGFQKKMITPENDYAELISGETTIAFASQDLSHSNFGDRVIDVSTLEKPIAVELAFITENIEEDFQKAIIAGAIEFTPIQQKPWGQKVGYLKDNNGFLIEICTPM